MLEVQNEDGEPRDDLKPKQQTEQSHEKNAAPFSVLDKGNPKFYALLLTLNSVTSSLHISPRDWPH